MIWGLKTVALIDIWTLEHFLSGVSIGMLVISINSKLLLKHFNVNGEKIKTSHFDIVAVLFLAYLWEALEHYLETGLAGATVEYWLQGVEFWANRLVCDPLATIIGYYLAKTYPILVNPARVMSLLWLIIHIFVFPHSMYLHELMK